MLKISIPTPCHEDWNKMTPDETGRHCSSCAKSVVDFTGMTDDEVKYFFINKKENERVCGHFKQTQLQSIVIELPQNILHINMPLWKKFLAACLIAFSTALFSCETKVNGKAMAVTEINNNGNLLSDDNYVDGMVSGFDTFPPPLKPPVSIQAPMIELQGAVALVDDSIVIKTDTIPGFTKKGEVDAAYVLSRQDTLKINGPITPAKTKNPPKADSINCKTIKNYY